MALPQAVQMIADIKKRVVEMSGFLVPSGVILMWSGTVENIPKGWALCNGTQGTPDLRDRFIIGAGGKYGLNAKGGAENVTPEVSTGTAKTGISLANAAPGGTAGIATTRIGIQNASISVTTGSAKSGVTVQNTTLNTNTMPSHGHTIKAQNAGGYGDGAGILGNGDIIYNNYVQNTGNSWAHTHGISDPGHTHSVSAGQHHGINDSGHTHSVTTSAHNHTVTDGGHSHTVTVKAISTLSPYYALCLIQKL